MKNKLAARKTGSYDVILVEQDDEYLLAVRYTGEWGSGEWVELSLDGERLDEWLDARRIQSDNPAEWDRAAVSWFATHVRGDQDVERILQQNYFDRFTNPQKRRR